MMKFSNPLYKRQKQDSSPLSQADPYMIEHDGEYYVYATNHDGVIAYKSDNLFDWMYCGCVYKEENRKEYWAPSVLEKDGKFYMYVSNMPIGSDDTHDQNIRVAVSDSPLGQYKFNNVLLPPFSIDAHVVENKIGELFIFYSVNDYNAERAGTYIVVDKMINPFSVEGNPVAAVVPTLDEEIFERDRFKKGQHWHTIEGAFYFEHEDIHYLMYSGSAFTKESYFIGYSMSKSKETDLRNLNFRKMPDSNTYSPVLRRNGFVEGTGHNSVIKIGNSFFNVYHGRSTSEEIKDKDTRTFRMDKLTVNNGILKCIATLTEQEIK